MTRKEAINMLMKDKEQRGNCFISEAIDMAIQALEQEPISETDIILTREEYGELVSSEYDNGYAKGYREALEQEPTTKNDLGVDAVSRQAVLDLIADYDLSMGQVVKGIHALPSVTPQEPRWIPVSERLPDEGYSVLVMRITDDNYKYMRAATYQGDCWMDDTDKFNKPNPHKVIAWMPLPKPYEPQESEDNK